MNQPDNSAPLNGDLSRPVAVDTAALDWTASPSPSVWRKRVHRVGPAESGQVTSVVRYEPDSRFPPHDHPDGEEILVLEGVFSDEAGNWAAGSYLLNPEGYRHAPFSQEGCTILVKLRQAPGPGRDHIQLQSADLDWSNTVLAGVESKSLYRQAGFTDHVRLERWAAATPTLEREWPEGVEIFVLDGSFEDEAGRFGTGSWLRLPPGSHQRVHSEGGCELYVKEGGFTYLLDDPG